MLDSLQKWFKDYLTQKDFKKRLIIMNIGVFFMGFFLSFLIKVNLGTDPCTFMNLTISRFLGISFGNWQLLLNSVLFRVEFYSNSGKIADANYQAAQAAINGETTVGGALHFRRVNGREGIIIGAHVFW